MAGISHSDDDRIVQEAKRALNDVFGDRSVPNSTTVQRLKDILGDIEIMLDALEQDQNE